MSECGGGRRWGCVVVGAPWLGGSSDRRPSLSSSDRRCCVVVRAVAFGGRLHIRDVHAMRKDSPVLMRMHDARCHGCRMHTCIIINASPSMLVQAAGQFCQHQLRQMQRRNRRRLGTLRVAELRKDVIRSAVRHETLHASAAVLCALLLLPPPCAGYVSCLARVPMCLLR